MHFLQCQNILSMGKTFNDLLYHGLLVLELLSHLKICFSSFPSLQCVPSCSWLVIMCVLIPETTHPSCHLTCRGTDRESLSVLTSANLWCLAWPCQWRHCCGRLSFSHLHLHMKTLATQGHTHHIIIILPAVITQDFCDALKTRTADEKDCRVRTAWQEL